MPHNPLRSQPVLGILALLGLVPVAGAATFNPFSFQSNVSTSGVYSDGDVRLDSVSFANTTLVQAQLQTVSAATIVRDDAVDATNGGHNFAAAYGISSPQDAWAPEGPATIDPTGADLQAALGNYNLTSLVVTRENVGTSILEVSFAQPSNTFFFWERGSAAVQGNSDLLVEALGAGDVVTASYKILRNQYSPTNIAVTSWNGAFSSPSTPTGAKPVLGSIGLQLDDVTSKLRLTAVQITAGGSGQGDNGPDFKLVASATSVAPVPIPAAAWLFASALLPLLRRRRRAFTD